MSKRVQNRSGQYCYIPTLLHKGSDCIWFTVRDAWFPIIEHYDEWLIPHLPNDLASKVFKIIVMTDNQTAFPRLYPSAYTAYSILNKQLSDNYTVYKANYPEESGGGLCRPCSLVIPLVPRSLLEYLTTG